MTDNRIIHTNFIDIGAAGTGPNGETFLGVMVHQPDGATICDTIRTDEGGQSLQNELNRVNRSCRAGLTSQKARTEFINRLQVEGRKASTFSVLTKPGAHGSNIFVLGNEILSNGDEPEHVVNLAQLDDSGVDIAKFRVGGSLDGFNQILELARGNSRLIFGLGLALLGLFSMLYELALLPVGVQFHGAKGTGKSILAYVISLVWGRHHDTTQATQYGSAETWNATLNALDSMCLAHNQMLLVLDETRTSEEASTKKRSDTILDAAFRIDSGLGKARYKGGKRPTWYTPTLSTSNVSMKKFAALKGEEDPEAYLDRFLDIPVPSGHEYFFERLHGKSIKSFARRLNRLGAENFGHPGRACVQHLLLGIQNDRKEVVRDFCKSLRHYEKEAVKEFKCPKDAERVHTKFAQVYAACRMACRWKIYPFEMSEVYAAVLACERDYFESLEK